jgi:hypothetical protein
MDSLNGGYQSVEEIGGPGITRPTALAVDELGNAYVAGDFNGTTLTIGTTALTNAASSSFDGFVGKFSSVGIPMWAKRVGGDGNDAVWSVDTGSGIAVVAAGSTSSSMSFGATNLIGSRPLGAGETNLYLGKIDSDGNTLGALAVGSGLFTATIVRINDAESVYVAGSFEETVRIGTSDAATRGSEDIFVMKATTGSGVKWWRTFGSAAKDFFYSIKLDGSRSPVVAFGSNQGREDVQIGSMTYPILSLSSFFVRVGPEGALI